MSLRSFGDANSRNGNGKKLQSKKGRIRSASLSVMEHLEQRKLLNAQVFPTQPTLVGVQNSPLAPRPTQTFWVNGNGTSAAYQNASAVTPNTVNDLVLNVTAFAQNYTACCEGNNGGQLGNTGSVNAGRLLTNGLTQNQIGGFPATGFTAAQGDGLASDPSNGFTVLSQNGTGGWWLEYNLGAAPGATASGTGYDISEIDVIAGHQDFRTGMQVDIQVQFLNANSTDWFSLSNGRNFNFTADNSGTQISRGSAQMAIVNNASGPMVSNVRSLKFVASNNNTWFRELVVTGVASPNTPPAPGPMPAPVAAPDARPGVIDLGFTLAANGFQYSIQRATVVSGVVGTFSQVGGTVQFTGTGSFVDSNTAAGTTYVYRVVASNPTSSSTSANSNLIVTPPTAVEAHYYNMSFWEGPVTLNQGLAIMSVSNGGSWGPGIRGSQDSAVFTGQITTNAAGTYTFFSNTDDDGYLYINGALVSSDPGGHGQRDAGTTFDINGTPQGTYIPIILQAGQPYDFVLLEHNGGGGAGANIDWVTPSAPASRQLVPAGNLTPQSSHPATPTIVSNTVNSNFVNFTFSANNDAVVHYILQRAQVGPDPTGFATNIAGTTWVTVNQIDPGSNSYTLIGNAINTVTNRSLTIQDADPIPGLTYIYRVGAVNFDGAAYSPTIQPTLTAVADIQGTPSGAPVLSAGSDLVSPPNTAANVSSTADATGLIAGTYFVKYSWTNNVGGESQSSAEQSIVLAAPSDIRVGIPVAPFAATNANIYISTATNTEKLAGTVAGGATLTIATLPLFSANKVPTSSVATLSTVTDSTSSLAAGTYFVEYAWRNSAGQTTSSSLEQTIAVAAGSTSVKVQVPSAPSGASNANIYISTVSGGELLAGTTAGSTLVINVLPTTTAAAPLTNTAGLTPGTYFVKYNWVDNFSNATGSSPESTIVLTAPLSDIRVGGSAPSNSAATFNVFVSTTTGTEKLAGNVARGSTFTINSIPTTTAAAPATPLATFTTAVDATGLPAGTYFVEYTWTNSVGSETAASFEQSVVTTGTGDLVVNLPTAPAGAVNSNIYISSTSGGERLASSQLATQTAVIKGLPFSLATAAPTNSNVGLPAGTYFVAYTWVGDNTTTSGESSIDYIDPQPAVSGGRVIKSDEKTIVLTQASDIVVSTFGTIPTGVGSVNVYIGTATGAEKLAGNIPTSGSLTIKSLPSSTQPGIPTSLNNTIAAVSNPPLGPIGIPLPANNVPANFGGVEIHMYNQELFERFGSPANNNLNAFAVAQNGLATEYVAQTTVQTLGTFLPGPIDRDYGQQIIFSSPPPQSPDNTLFPDIPRIHTESFAQAFTGTLTVGSGPNQSGIYTIISNTDDEGYVWLNGQLVSADPGGHGQQDANPLTGSAPGGNGRTQDTILPVFLSSGNTYDLVFFMGQTGGGSGAHLKWVMPAVTNNQNAAGASNTGSFGATINLGAFATPPFGSYNNYTIFITSGTGAGQAGIITQYDPTNHIATLNVTTRGSSLLWSNVPDSTSGYSINYVEAIPILGDDTFSGGGLQMRSDLPNQGVWTGSTNAGGVGTSVVRNNAQSAAQSLTITSVSASAGVTLQWADQGLDELWYEVQRSTDNVSFKTVGTTPMNIGTTFTDTTAGNAFNSPTISYFYRVRGVNFDGAGVFTPVINTTNNVNISVPTINAIVQGKPGSAGLIISGGSVNAGGLDIQYAPVVSGTTGSFIDATPIALPANTFDFQVTGLTPTTTYVFKVRNLPGFNNPVSNSALFSAIASFVPSGAITPETFGAPGTGVGGFASAGDLQLNGNARLTGTGVPPAPTPTTALLNASINDLTNPTVPAGITSSSDTPQPSVAATLITNSSNLALSNAGTFFLEYTWVTANGETLPLAGAQIANNPGWVSNGSHPGINVTYQVPTAAPAGAVNANIYIGTSSNTADELLSGNVAIGGTRIINTFPTGARSAPAASGTGVPPATYYIEYSWLNTANQETLPSPEQTVVVTFPSNDITVTLPAAPVDTSTVPSRVLANRGNIYIGTSSGSEHLSATQAVSGNTASPLIIRGLPATSAKTPVAINQSGLGLGTYFLDYSWVSSQPNQGVTGETVPSPLQTIVVSGANTDLQVQLPTLPAGVGSANVYLGYQVANPGATPVALTATTTGSLTAGTYFVNYEWFTTNPAATLPSTAEQTVTVAANGGISVVTPAIPYGVAGAKVFVGTAAGAESLAGTISGNFATIQTFTINSLPTAPLVGFDAANTTGTTALTRVGSGGSSTAVTNLFIQQLALGGTLAPISSPAVGTLVTSSVADLVNPIATATVTNVTGGAADSSLNAGVYYVQYTWLASSGGETAGSPEQTVTLGSAGLNGPQFITVQVPTAPVGASTANVYVGTVSGGEQLSGNIGSGGTLNVKGLPATSAKATPTLTNVGIPAGTYFVAFTWTSGNGLETAGSTEQTVTVSNVSNDLIVTIPTAPAGASQARVYLGSASGKEFFAGSANPGTSLTITTLPTINAKIIPTANSTSLRYTTPANALQLNNNNNGQTASAFNLGEDINGFTTSFDFQLSGNMSADGFGFVLEDGGARTSIGGGGGGLGYSGINHSVGIFFQTYLGGSFNGTGIGTNGNTPGNWINMNTVAGLPTGVQVTDTNPTQNQRLGDIFNVNLSYDPNLKVLTETVFDKTLKDRGVNNSFTQNYSIDIVATLGMPAAFVGFTGGSGGASSEKDILNWSFTTTGGIVTLDTITGTAGVDTITLKRDASDATKIDWTISGNTGNFQLATNDTNGLTINGLGGNDIINLDYSNGNPLPNTIHFNGTFTINNLNNGVAMGAANPLANTNFELGRSTVFIPYAGGLGASTATSNLFRNYLAGGYSAGAWTGVASPTTGVITSTPAKNNVNHNTAIGWADSNDGTGINTVPNSIELKYTLAGDATLNGAVDIFDLNALLPNFNAAGNWTGGDSTYTGTVDIFDLNALLPNFNTTLGAQLTPAVAAATPAAATSSTTSSSSSTSSNSSLANVAPSVTLTKGTTTGSNSGSAAVNAASSVVDSSNSSKKPAKKPVKKHK